MSAQPLRPELIARMTAVETFIGGRARPTTKDLLFFLKFGRGGTAECLRHLVDAGRIQEAVGVRTRRSKVWAIRRAGAPATLANQFINARPFAAFDQIRRGAA